MKSSKLYFDKDCDISIIQSKRVGVIGYGNQGKAQVLNLIDSQIDVIVGLRHNSKSKLELDGRNIPNNLISVVVDQVDVIVVLVPDKSMKNCYYDYIHNHLKDGQTIIFSHGYNVHYNLIDIPENINVAMIAPSGGGAIVRSKFIDGEGVPGLIAVDNDPTGDTISLIKSYGIAIGCARVCLFESTFKEETETDLYGEQVLLTGGLPMYINKTLKVLLESGYSPEVSWFVCYYELKTIVDLFHEKGLDFLYSAISDTAKYGGLTRGEYLIDSNMELKMKSILKEIQSGEFHKELENGKPKNYESPFSKDENEIFDQLLSTLFTKKK